MNTADILDKAADLIEERGWHQGDYVGPTGCLCPYGAMYLAVGITPAGRGNTNDWPGWTPDRGGPFLDAARWLARYLRGRAVSVWNDAEGRTKEEVVSTLRAAAQAARETDG